MSRRTAAVAVVVGVGVVANNAGLIDFKEGGGVINDEGALVGLDLLR